MSVSKQDIEKAFQIVQDVAETKLKEKDDRIADLKKTIKGFDGLISIHNQTNSEQQRCIDNLKETIKGCDRAIVEYTRIIAEKDETIDTLTNVNQAHSAMLKLKHNEVSELEQRIATLLEAQASVPTRDVNGTIEALDKANACKAEQIKNQQAVIKQYRTEMQALQRKVQEQDERMAGDGMILFSTRKMVAGWIDEWYDAHPEALKCSFNAVNALHSMGLLKKPKGNQP
jgi:chromosome segregation ATPase